jgi:hypothetical protein
VPYGSATREVNVDGIPFAENRTLRVIEMPAAYKDPEFLQWLSEAIDQQGTVATWYAGGEMSQEHADIFMTVETTKCTFRVWDDLVRDAAHMLGDGSNSDMPKKWFRTICIAVGPSFDGLVWIKNVPDWSGP